MRCTHLLTTDVDRLSRRAAPEKLRASTTRPNTSMEARPIGSFAQLSKTILFRFAPQCDRTRLQFDVSKQEERIDRRESAPFLQIVGRIRHSSKAAIANESGV